MRVFGVFVVVECVEAGFEVGGKLGRTVVAYGGVIVAVGVRGVVGEVGDFARALYAC
jgi:hypothetical protein